MSEREHDTNGVDCWCGPRFTRPCDECDDGNDGIGCWKCEHGLQEITREEAVALREVGVGIIIIHAAPADDREPDQ